MTVEQQEWIRKDLGPRIDALEAAMNALDATKSDSVVAIRRVLQSLQASSRAAGLGEIAGATALAYNAGNLEIKGRAASLIQMLRDQGRKAQSAVVGVLLVGSDANVLPELEKRLMMANRQVFMATTAKEAERVLRESEIIFIVVDFYLPDQEIRQFVSTIRCRPLTAAVPMIVVSSRATANDAVVADIMPDIDGFFGAPLNLDEVFAMLEERIKGARDRMQSASRDPVTGLLTRAAFGEYFERAMTRHRETKEPIAIIMMKIDRFQQLCDQHGAQAGDKMLKHFGTIATRIFRTSDSVARWGGCEFMGLFPGEDNQGATRAMERIREALVREPFVFPNGRSEPLKLFAGITVYPEQPADAAHRPVTKTADGTDSGGANGQSKRKDKLVIITANETTSRVLNHMLAREGFDLQFFPRVDEMTLKFLETTKCQLICVDDNGQPSDLEDLHQLRVIPRQSRTPIIVLASNAERAAQAMEYGASDHVAKPLDVASFIKTARRLLTRGIHDDQNADSAETLLVIGGDLTGLIMLGTALQKQTGFNILLARGGHDGIAQLSKHRPNVTLIDIRPRGKDWQELIDALSVLRPAPAIVVAVEPDDYQLVRALKSPPIKGIITKPLQPLAVARQVQDACGIVPAGTPGRPETAALLKQEMDRIMRLPPS